MDALIARKGDIPVADLSDLAQQIRDLADGLTAVGEDGLRRELLKALSAAADPIAKQIRATGNLRDHMPGRYADVLAEDLQVTAHARAGLNPEVTILARAPTVGRGGRKIRQRNAGVITHPLFGNRERWYVQEKGMVEGFFDTPVERAAPAVREAIRAAVNRAEDQALGKA